MRIYEALNKRNRVSKPEAALAAFSAYGDAGIAISQRDELLRVYQTVDAMLPDGAPRIIELISATQGEGTSTIASQLAMATAQATGERVLLLTVEAGEEGPPPASGNDIEIDPPGEVPFHRARIVSAGPTAYNIFDPARLDAIFERLRCLCDILYIDSPPALTQPAGLTLAHRATAVILVIEAEQTRLPIIDQARRMIESNGGRVLGTILNKRRFYIPQSIYRWL